MFTKPKNKLFYGWVIVIFSGFTTLILTGTRFSFGVFFKPLANEFDLTRAATSSLFSIHMILCAFFTIAGGWTLDRYGPRLVYLLMGLFTGLSLLLTSQANSYWQLFIIYSLLLSIGIAPHLAVMNALVSKWFDKKRGFAIGIAGSIARLGQVFYAPFCAFLISAYDWRIAYMVMGLIVWFVVIPASRLMKNDPREIGALPDGAKFITTQLEDEVKEDYLLSGLSLSQALRTKNYWILSFAWLFIATGNMLVWTHVVPYATDVNITAVKAATIISVIAVFAIPSGILIGRFSDIKGRIPPLIIICLFRAVVLVGLIWASELWMFYVLAISLGISIGGSAVILVTLNVDIFGKRNIGVIMGTLDVFASLGCAIGPFLGGLVYDINNSYTVAFIIAATANIILVPLVSLIKVKTK